MKNKFKNLKELPARTKEVVEMNKDMIKKDLSLLD